MTDCKHETLQKAGWSMWACSECGKEFTFKSFEPESEEYLSGQVWRRY